MNIISKIGDAANGILGFTVYSPTLLQAAGVNPGDDVMKVVYTTLVTAALMTVTKVIAKAGDYLIKKIFKGKDIEVSIKEPPEPPAPAPQPLPDSITLQK